MEFRQQVTEFRALLQELDNIEIRLGDPALALSEPDKRLLRRVAFEYHAASVSATSLAGGLTGASVWRCDLSRPQGSVATVVAKRVQKVAPPGGLSEMLPRAQTTSRIATLAGLVGGDFICVLQVAGIAPRVSDDSAGVGPRSGRCVRQVGVGRAGRSIRNEPTPKRCRDLCVADRLEWLRDVADGFGISIPAGSLFDSQRRRTAWGSSSATC